MKTQGSDVYINYGCGLSAPDGWINFDASPTLRLQRISLFQYAANRLGPRFPSNVKYGDVTKGLPVQNSSAQIVYCSHVLEHLALEDLRSALRETNRILIPGGIFRMVLPDLEMMIERYHKRRGQQLAAMDFMRETKLGQNSRSRGFYQFLRDFFGNSQHRWMWDYASLSQELADAGFEQIRRAQIGDNPEPMLLRVEEADRWLGRLGIECRKPFGK